MAYWLFLFAKIIIILNLNLTVGIGRKRRNIWCEQGQIESQILVQDVQQVIRISFTGHVEHEHFSRFAGKDAISWLYTKIGSKRMPCSALRSLRYAKLEKNRPLHGDKNRVQYGSSQHITASVCFLRLNSIEIQKLRSYLFLVVSTNHSVQIFKLSVV